MIFLWRISNLKTIGEVPFENWRTLINVRSSCTPFPTVN